jgi:hypothetical protein
VLHKSLLATGTHKRWCHRLTSFYHPIRFHQEQFAFSQPEKGLATLLVGAVTQHVFETRSAPLEKNLGEHSEIPLLLQVVCQKSRQ